METPFSKHRPCFKDKAPAAGITLAKLRLWFNGEAQADEEGEHTLLVCEPSEEA